MDNVCKSLNLPLHLNFISIMKKFTTFFIAFILCTLVYAQERFVVRISQPAPADYKEFFSQGFDIAAYSPGIFIDLVVDQNLYNELLSQGYSLTITQTEQQLKANLKSVSDLTGYRSYSDLLTELQNIQAAHPDICKLYDIGDSQGKFYTAPAYNNYKHDIWALKVSDNVDVEEDEPCIFYLGTHHAREPISLEVTMYILNQIVDNYGTDPDITNSVNNKQIWFVPLVNPDGHKVIWDGINTWWRKNIRDNDNNNIITLSAYADGVDNNRNYGWEWGGEGTTTDPTGETYCGTSAFSEPETQAIKNLIDTHHFVTGITYHSYGELVLYPYGYSSPAFAPDNDCLEDLAVNMANTIPSYYGGHYTPEKSSGLYPASGTTDDYAYGQHGVFCFTIEVAVQFIPPASEIQGICEDNLQAAKILLDRVDQSTLTGLVKDANTLQPVEAEVSIEGIDNTGAFREPWLSDATFGRYYRLLLDGNYTVTFSAYGYLPQTFSGVNINSAGQTVLNVNLVPAQSVTVTGVVTDLETGLPIEDATIEVLNTPVSPVTTNTNGEYTIPVVMEGTYDFRVNKLNYATIIQSKNVTVANHVFDFQLQVSTAWSFESGGFEPQWTFGGNAPWYIANSGAYDGLYCSHSGAIGNSASSDMSISLTFSSGGVVSFYRKVSSEANYDYLKFYIDNVSQGQWAGEAAWGEVNYSVTAGTHTMKWSYSKDAGCVSGSDCAWVDYIIFPPIIPPPTPADISIDPLSLDVTLSPNTSLTKHITMSNLGESNLTYSIFKQTPVNQAKVFCTASGGCDEYISKVVFNTINNTSGSCSSGGYADYSAISTNVDAGQTYSLVITIGNYYSTDDLGVWIDWNQNLVFTDAGENVACAYSTPSTTTFSITVPNDALSGSVRMRIRLKYSGNDCGTSCGTTTYGEVEDYTLIVYNNVAPWLTISPLNGTVNGQESQMLDLTFNSN